MAVSPIQYFGSYELSPKDETSFSRHNSKCEVFKSPNACRGVLQLRSSEQDVHHVGNSSSPKSSVPARSTSLDDNMDDVEAIVSRYAQRLDSAIVLEDDDDEEESCPPPKPAMSPRTILGAGRVDPFANYPVKMDVTEYWLIDHVNIAQHPTFKVFKDSWLPIAMSDPATFHQVLSNIALSVPIVRGEGVVVDDPVAIAHSSLAVRTVNNRLSDSVMGISDGTMTSVLGLTCQSAIRKDFKTWAIHLSGLEDMISLRGGLDSLSNNPKLRLLILWVEVAGACRQDIAPRFPLPTHLLPTASSTSQPHMPSTRIPVLDAWKRLFPLHAEIPDIFDHISIVITLARSPSAKKDQGHFNLLWITPRLHRLLSLARPSPAFPDAAADPQTQTFEGIQEVARLGIILFLASLRRKCGDLGVPTEIQVSKLRAMLNHPGWARWALFEPLVMWCLFFGALEGRGEDKKWFCSSLCLAAGNMDIRDWKGLVREVTGFLWIGDVFEQGMRELQKGFEWDRVLGARRSV